MSMIKIRKNAFLKIQTILAGSVGVICRSSWAAFGKRTILYGCAIAVGCTPVLYGVFRGFGLNRIT